MARRTPGAVSTRTPSARRGTLTRRRSIGRSAPEGTGSACENTEPKESQMANIEKSIDVDVPVRTAYNQWTQFEEFPRFMEGVEAVRQVDDTHTHWRTKVAGKAKEFDAVITEQTPDQRIAWTSEGGPEHAGVVTFHRIDDGRTRVMLQMDYEPEGLAEKAGDALGLVERRVRGDLQRFKELIESRGVESGAWRGEVDQTATR
jgi:uncharacterized membrane protein